MIAGLPYYMESWNGALLELGNLTAGVGLPLVFLRRIEVMARERAYMGEGMEGVSFKILHNIPTLGGGVKIP